MDSTSPTNRIELQERYKMLMEKKKKTVKTMDKYRRLYIKSRIEKKRINQEVKKIAEEFKLLAATNPEAAQNKILDVMKNMNSEDIFPADLEKEFDALGHIDSNTKNSIVEVDDYLVSTTEVIAGGKHGDIMEVEIKPEDDSDEDVPADLRAKISEDTEIGFGDEDMFIEGGVETVTRKSRKHDGE
jgi:hypothetical protein